MLAVATLVSWPQQSDSDTQALIGQPLFPAFTDPLAASSLRIVRFDDVQGTLQRFEVAKDEATGVWSLPSRNNYPADASEQMQKAANSLVDVNILDVQTENTEDHASLGVVEPNADTLQVGDEGVGLLVSFKGDKNASLADLIVGLPTPTDPSKRYVRIAGQNPVYVVTLDPSVFSTRFPDWIEADLLQLSSIDIAQVEVQDYDAALEGAGTLNMSRNYSGTFGVDGASGWDLLSLVRYNDQQQAEVVELEAGQSLNAVKLNELKNALDDLKIADVAAKPKGMSENLRADKELVSDNEAVRSLALRGFFPVSSGEIISANGEMTVTLQDGVQYLLRFGNVQGLSEEEASGEEAEEGESSTTTSVNRYLLVTAQVDESKFPPPALRPVPTTIEELDAMNQPAAEDQPAPEEEPGPEAEPAVEAESAMDQAESSAEAAVDEAAAGEEPAEEAAAPPVDETAGEPADAEPASEQPASEQPVVEEAASEEPASEQAAAAESSGDDAASEESSEIGAQSDPPAIPAEAGAAEPAAEQETAEQANAADQMDAADDQAGEELEETAEEKQERLEAEQERITRENQRLLDERNDRLEAARTRVRELNSRFADWYYVIPESTYRQLRLPLSELITSPDEAAQPPLGGLPDFGGFDPSQGPGFTLPGFDE